MWLEMSTVICRSRFSLRIKPLQTYLEYQRKFPLDAIFFVYAMLIGLVLSVFLPLFFGSEYSDGTIRNKLAAGHPRLSVYLANLITAVLHPAPDRPLSQRRKWPGTAAYSTPPRRPCG